MDSTLGPAPLPVSGVDAARAFHTDRLGSTVDVDVSPAPGVRVVQVTPPGSGCSIGFGSGFAVHEGVPGSVRGLHLVVADVAAARADLVGRGVEVGEVTDVGGGVLHAGLQDPDGNSLVLQQMPWRTGDAF